MSSTLSYSNTELEPLFAGCFEEENEEKKAEMLQILELELLLEIEDQMPYIRYVCQNHRSIGAESLRVDVEVYAQELAFKRRHSNPQEPVGDADKRLRAYWNDPDKREAYPDLFKQLKYVVRSIVQEAITHNPRWSYFVCLPYFDEIGLHFNPTNEEEMEILDVLTKCEENGMFSEDEIAYIHFVRKWRGDKLLPDVQIEKELGWYQSKAYRVKKSIKKKVILGCGFNHSIGERSKVK